MIFELIFPNFGKIYETVFSDNTTLQISEVYPTIFLNFLYIVPFRIPN